jgi:hypothetical protein
MATTQASTKPYSSAGRARIGCFSVVFFLADFFLLAAAAFDLLLLVLLLPDLLLLDLRELLLPLDLRPDDERDDRPELDELFERK